MFGSLFTSLEDKQNQGLTVFNKLFLKIIKNTLKKN